ncbi:MAG: FAD-dependent oxidoreductase [Sandaracinaceae bacterium]
MTSGAHYDWIIVGSGFGGSVSALRLTEKGYRVLVIEKGRRWAKEEFPKNNMDLARWLWMPALGLKGFFQMSFLEHVTILHGVGVGGGSLTYANTLPMPKLGFFQAKSWAHLADWKRELDPHYETARHMLGAAEYPGNTPGDDLLLEIAEDLGRAEHFHKTDVGVFFGPPGEEVPDPYFGGEGPARTGCTHCGACMTGCRVGAKNTLDRNYLYLAEAKGCEVLADTEVLAVRPEDEGYALETKRTDDGSLMTYTADRVVFAGGVMGTVPLLLKMKEDPRGLPRLSDRLGDFVRTNSEAILGALETSGEHDYSKGIAITSILHTDEHSHVEPVRYGEGSNFFRWLVLPHVPGKTLLGRTWGALAGFAKEPGKWLRAYAVPDFGKAAQVLLYMRSMDGTLSMRLGRNVRTGFTKGLVTKLDDPSSAPAAFMREATDLARRWAKKTGGVTATMFTELLLGVPSTAHILGGCCMGKDIASGVIDTDHRVFGYDGLYVIDGSAVSANPGVNPSLTITALAERAMSRVPARA